MYEETIQQLRSAGWSEDKIARAIERKIERDWNAGRPTPRGVKCRRFDRHCPYRGDPRCNLCGNVRSAG